MSSPALNEAEIIHYYDHCQVDYALVWQLDEALCMHYGYWDETTPHHRASVHQMNHQVARAAGIEPGMHVLDAGCGVGGPSIFLAHRGCTVEGITLSEKQVDTCRENARKAQITDRVHFSRQNYLKTEFADNTFDVVWAIESVCYAWDKSDFTREAYRILKPGGRMVVADFFATPVVPGSPADILMKKWTDAWAIKAYATVAEFTAAIETAGLELLEDRNITRQVTPSIRRLYLSFFPGLLTTTIAQWLGIRNHTQTKNTWSTYFQYQAFQKKLWEYHLFCAQK
jgi:cyclopropane fatty-acyl-phospholipid synthase-like methyltransferase